MTFVSRIILRHFCPLDAIRFIMGDADYKSTL